MEFVFHTTEYDPTALTPQVSRALRQRTERLSRKALPGVWKQTDRLNARRAPEEVLKRRRVRYRIYGFLLIAMGLFLLVPGLMRPRELKAVLLMGIWLTFMGIGYLIATRKHRRTKFDRAAAKLLAQIGSAGAIEVRFGETGVMLNGEVDVPYDRVEYAIETADALLLTWNGQATVLQRRDLEGDWQTFRAFLAERLDDHLDKLICLSER